MWHRSNYDWMLFLASPMTSVSWNLPDIWFTRPQLLPSIAIFEYFIKIAVKLLYKNCFIIS